VGPTSVPDASGLKGEMRGAGCGVRGAGKCCMSEVRGVVRGARCGKVLHVRGTWAAFRSLCRATHIISVSSYPSISICQDSAYIDFQQLNCSKDADTRLEQTFVWRALLRQRPAL
jgi:hypothetical protein